ncbi:hypothetical protein HDU93_008069 [Gonapodya sp. JEL0774]|nr:hypothetical protein HDU93_008069 [Gonapodya sp. JEL0774]
MSTSETSLRLLLACEQIKTEDVKKALKAGADPNVRKIVTLVAVLQGGQERRDTQQMESVLAIAIRNENADIVTSLLGAGADPNRPISWRVAACHPSGSWSSQQWESARWIDGASFSSALEFSLSCWEGKMNKRGPDITLKNPEVPGEACDDSVQAPNLNIVSALLSYGARVSPAALQTAASLKTRKDQFGYPIDPSGKFIAMVQEAAQKQPQQAPPAQTYSQHNAPPPKYPQQGASGAQTQAYPPHPSAASHSSSSNNPPPPSSSDDPLPSAPPPSNTYPSPPANWTPSYLPSPTVVAAGLAATAGAATLLTAHTPKPQPPSSEDMYVHPPKRTNQHGASTPGQGYAPPTGTSPTSPYPPYPNQAHQQQQYAPAQSQSAQQQQYPPPTSQPAHQPQNAPPQSQYTPPPPNQYTPPPPNQYTPPPPNHQQSQYAPPPPSSPYSTPPSYGPPPQQPTYYAPPSQNPPPQVVYQQQPQYAPPPALKPNVVYVNQSPSYPNTDAMLASQLAGMGIIGGGGHRPGRYGGAGRLGDGPDFGGRPYGDGPDFGGRPHADGPDFGGRPNGDGPDFGGRPNADGPDFGGRPHADGPDIGGMFGGGRPHGGGDGPDFGGGRGDGPDFGGRPHDGRPHGGGDGPDFGGGRRHGGDGPDFGPDFGGGGRRD